VEITLDVLMMFIRIAAQIKDATIEFILNYDLRRDLEEPLLTCNESPDLQVLSNKV